MGIFDSLRAVFRPRLTYQVSMGPNVSVADMGIDFFGAILGLLAAVVVLHAFSSKNITTGDQL